MERKKFGIDEKSFAPSQPLENSQNRQRNLWKNLTESLENLTESLEKFAKAWQPGGCGQVRHLRPLASSRGGARTIQTCVVALTICARLP
jgi:hypothetical protein